MISQTPINMKNTNPDDQIAKHDGNNHNDTRNAMITIVSNNGIITMMHTFFIGSHDAYLVARHTTGADRHRSMVGTDG